MSVPDHLVQLTSMGGAASDMLEAYTTLGFLAAHTSRVRLFALVSPPNFRYAGVLAKSVATVDVLSGGRAWLGLGAGSASDEVESAAMGVPCPPVRERFVDVEDVLRACLRLWRDEVSAPRPLTAPHPPILIAGDGERHTLRLVARYADACGLIPGPEIARKLDVLRRHCEAEGRDYAAIAKTVNLTIDVGRDGSRTRELVAQLRELHELGVDTVFGREVAHVETLVPLAAIGRDVIPEVAGW